MSGPAQHHAALTDVPLPDLLTRARAVRDDAHGRRTTFSPKVFIPLTRLCRDKCHYCTFVTVPGKLAAAGLAPYLSPDEVVEINGTRGHLDGVVNIGQAGEAIRGFLDR